MNYLQNLFMKATGATFSVQPRSQSRYEVVNSFADDEKKFFSNGHENSSEKKKNVPSAAINPNLNSTPTPPFLSEKAQKNSQEEDWRFQTEKPLLVTSENEIEFPQKNNIGKQDRPEILPKKESKVAYHNEAKIHPDIPSPKPGLLNHSEKERPMSPGNDNSSIRDIRKMEQRNGPTIKISIGRLEVKTVRENKNPSQKAVKNYTPVMTLQDYIDAKK